MSPRPGAAPCPPVRGPPRGPPSRSDSGPLTGHTPKVKNVFRFRLDAKSIPEALATTFRILLKFSIVLPRCIGPPRALKHASSAPHRTPIHPLSPRPTRPSRSVRLFFSRRTSQNHRSAPPQGTLAICSFFANPLDRAPRDLWPLDKKSPKFHPQKLSSIFWERKL